MLSLNMAVAVYVDYKLEQPKQAKLIEKIGNNFLFFSRADN